jgi:hypothetical protein
VDDLVAVLQKEIRRGRIDNAVRARRAFGHSRWRGFSSAE